MITLSTQETDPTYPKSSIIKTINGYSDIFICPLESYDDKYVEKYLILQRTVEYVS